MIVLLILSVGMISVFLKTVITNKDETKGIAENTVVYLCYTFLLFYLSNASFIVFSFENLLNSIERLVPSIEERIISVIVGVIVFFIISKIGSKIGNVVGCVLYYVATFILLIALNYAFFLDFTLIFMILILTVLAMICNIYIILKSNLKVSKSHINLIFTTLTVLLVEYIFGHNHVLQSNLDVLLNQALKWYVVLVIAVIAWMYAGYIFSNAKLKNKLELDAYIFTGVIGFFILLKSVVYFSYPFAWIFMIIYVVLTFLIYWNRINTDKKTHKDLVFEALSVAIIGVSLAAANVMTYFGYLAVVMIITIGGGAVHFISQNFKGWMKPLVGDLICITSCALIAIALSKHNLVSSDFTYFVIIVSIVSGLFLAAINFKSDRHRNPEDRVYATTLVCIVSMLLAFSAFRGGTDIDIFFDQSGSNLVDGTIITVEAEAQGKENKIVDLKYYWTDDFWFDSSDFKNNNVTMKNDGDKQVLQIKAQEGKLIVVATDVNGVITQKSAWFFLT